MGVGPVEVEVVEELVEVGCPCPRYACSARLASISSAEAFLSKTFALAYFMAEAKKVAWS